MFESLPKFAEIHENTGEKPSSEQLDILNFAKK